MGYAAGAGGPTMSKPSGSTPTAEASRSSHCFPAESPESKSGSCSMSSSVRESESGPSSAGESKSESNSGSKIPTKPRSSSAK
eukprot:3448287-Alexandrium_andersonii.AAC.1